MVARLFLFTTINMKQFCLKLHSIFMLLCVCISVPLFTSCSEEEDENSLMGYWVDQDYESRWAEQIRDNVKYAVREPYGINGTEKRFINNNTLNDVNVYAYYTKRDDAITTISVDGKTYYIVPEYKRTITYVINDNKIVCTDGCILTMADGLLYEDNTGIILTKLKKNNTNSENSLDNTNKLAKDIIGTWLNLTAVEEFDNSVSYRGMSQANEAFEDTGSSAEFRSYIMKKEFSQFNQYVTGRDKEGYIITSTSIRKFEVAINETEKSGQTTLKTFYLPDGTRYYFQMKLLEECSYWLLPVRDNFFATESFDWFDVEYLENGDIKWLSRYDHWDKLHGYYENMNKLYNYMSEYSWMK